MPNGELRLISDNLECKNEKDIYVFLKNLESNVDNEVHMYISWLLWDFNNFIWSDINLRDILDVYEWKENQKSKLIPALVQFFYKSAQIKIQVSTDVEYLLDTKDWKSSISKISSVNNLWLEDLMTAIRLFTEQLLLKSNREQTSDSEIMSELFDTQWNNNDVTIPSKQEEANNHADIIQRIHNSDIVEDDWIRYISLLTTVEKQFFLEQVFYYYSDNNGERVKLSTLSQITWIWYQVLKNIMQADEKTNILTRPKSIEQMIRSIMCYDNKEDTIVQLHTEDSEEIITYDILEKNINARVREKSKGEVTAKEEIPKFQKASNEEEKEDKEDSTNPSINTKYLSPTCEDYEKIVEEMRKLNIENDSHIQLVRELTTKQKQGIMEYIYFQTFPKHGSIVVVTLSEMLWTNIYSAVSATEDKKIFIRKNPIICLINSCKKQYNPDDYKQSKKRGRPKWRTNIWEKLDELSTNKNIKEQIDILVERFTNSITDLSSLQLHQFPAMKISTLRIKSKEEDNFLDVVDICINPPWYHESKEWQKLFRAFSGRLRDELQLNPPDLWVQKLAFYTDVIKVRVRYGDFQNWHTPIEVWSRDVRDIEWIQVLDKTTCPIESHTKNKTKVHKRKENTLEELNNNIQSSIDDYDTTIDVLHKAMLCWVKPNGVTYSYLIKSLCFEPSPTKEKEEDMLLYFNELENAPAPMDQKPLLQGLEKLKLWNVKFAEKIYLKLKILSIPDNDIPGNLLKKASAVVTEYQQVTSVAPVLKTQNTSKPIKSSLKNTSSKKVETGNITVNKVESKKHKEVNFINFMKDSKNKSAIDTLIFLEDIYSDLPINKRVLGYILSKCTSYEEASRVRNNEIFLWVEIDWKIIIRLIRFMIKDRKVNFKEKDRLLDQYLIEISQYSDFSFSELGDELDFILRFGSDRMREKITNFFESFWELDCLPKTDNKRYTNKWSGLTTAEWRKIQWSQSSNHMDGELEPEWIDLEKNLKTPKVQKDIPREKPEEISESLWKRLKSWYLDNKFWSSWWRSKKWYGGKGFGKK